MLNIDSFVVFLVKRLVESLPVFFKFVGFFLSELLEVDKMVRRGLESDLKLIGEVSAVIESCLLNRV